jgi:cyclic pyranopterin phosphate synthase
VRARRLCSLPVGRLPIVDADGGFAVTGPEAFPRPASGASARPGWLDDRQGRRLRYLRLSVTDRCDLRCTYCMPESGVPASPRDEVLSLEELARVARVFARLGVQTVRLTGGEPLVRKGIDELVRQIRDAGIDDIALTTNATALAPLAPRLAEAGLTRLNVSLDSLDPARFARLTRGGELARVLEGIEAAQAAGLTRIKLNTVLVRGENDGEAEAIVRWAWARDLVPRFIELMPLGAGASLGREAVVSSAELRARLAPLLDPEAEPEARADRGPAAYLPSRDGTRRVGFIGAVTENFCDRCNRVRVTAKGEIRACLASPEGLSLRALMRGGHGDDAIAGRILDALFGKREGHEFYVPGIDRHHDVAMSRIGG